MRHTNSSTDAWEPGPPRPPCRHSQQVGNDDRRKRGDRFARAGRAPRVAEASKRVGCAVLDPRPSAPPKLTVEETRAPEPRSMGSPSTGKSALSASEGLLSACHGRGTGEPPRVTPTGASGAPAIAALRAPEGSPNEDRRTPARWGGNHQPCPIRRVLSAHRLTRAPQRPEWH